MSAAPGEPRQRAVMATDSEWERVSKAAAAAGMPGDDETDETRAFECLKASLQCRDCSGPASPVSRSLCSPPGSGCNGTTSRSRRRTRPMGGATTSGTRSATPFMTASSKCAAPAATSTAGSRRPNRSLDRRRSVGHIYVITTSDGLIVKRLGRGKGGRWLLVSDNDVPDWPDVPSPDDAVVAGEVN